MNSPEYCCIAPLRALEMKKHNPEMWRRFLLLMDHDEERKLETDYQEMFQVTFEQQRSLKKLGNPI